MTVNTKKKSKASYFAGRCIKEIARDILSAIFCIAFPVIMLFTFAAINHFSSGMTPMFELATLTPSICCFSYTFVMLFMALLVSKDRSTSLLSRLYVSPLSSADYLIGYAAAGMLIALLQTAVCFMCGCLVALFIGADYLSIGGIALCFVTLLPTVLFYIALGMIFGSLFSDKAAPGICSIIISGGSMLSGAWMPLEQMGEFEAFCRLLPFYPAVTVARQTAALILDQKFLVSLLTTALYAVAAAIIAPVAFKRKR